LMIYRQPEILSHAITALFAVLTFSPVGFVHPVRVKRMRPLTLLMTLAWSVLAVIALLDNLDPGLGVRIALFVTTAYLTVIGAVLQLTRERDRWE